MKRHIVNIEWGIWHGYYHPSYLPVLDFSGEIEVEGGVLAAAAQADFGIHDAFGIRPTTHPLPGNRYRSVLQNDMSGLRLELEGDEATRVRLHTGCGDFAFTLGELYAKGHLAQYTGPRYSMAVFHAQPEKADWYIAPLRRNETALLPENFGRSDEEAFSIRGFALAPGETAEAAYVYAPAGPEGGEETVDMQLRFILCAPAGEGLLPERGIPDFQVRVNGRTVYGNVHFCTHHDMGLPFLEQVCAELPAACFREGENRITVVNRDKAFTLFIQQLRLRPAAHPPLEISACPQWAVCGQPFAVTLRTSLPAVKVDIEADGELVERTLVGGSRETFPLKQDCGTLMNIDFAVNEAKDRALQKGIHDFYFEAKKPCRDLTITFTDLWTGERATAVVPRVFDVRREEPAPMAGVELRTGSPEDYIPFIRWVRDAQIGNEIVFRDYHNDSGNEAMLWDAAAFCRRNGMFVDVIMMNRQSTVADGAGDRCVATGTHEHTGIFYGRDAILDTCRNLQEAAELSVRELSLVADSYRLPGVPVGVGDATGGSRYAYMAGFEYIRHETFVGHHALILPNARGCARAFGKPVWGAHVASMHNAQPELEGGMRRFFLGLFLPWVMGAAFAYEEDSLYQNYKYIKMVGDDLYTREKQRITAAFYRHITLHGRRGTPDVRIAVLQGRYAPPMNGISTANNYNLKVPVPECDDYPVFGHAGRTLPEWGFRQPEKGFHLLQVLAPGVFLPPLYQQAEKTRQFFNGDPNGEFDMLPCEAGGDVYGLYDLMLLLCWHTMTAGDCEKLREFVMDGGALFLSVPQLTTRSDREMLKDMASSDLALFDSEELHGLLGARVTRRADVLFSGAVSPGAKDFDFHPCKIEDCRRPNHSPEEDGPCYLAEMELQGAQVVLTDAASGKPVLLRHRCGAGTVYLLCAWAFPGHEALAELMPAVLQSLIDAHARPSVRVAADNDVYASVWDIDDTHKTVYLLNTDWVTPENKRPVSLSAFGFHYATDAVEGRVVEVAVFEEGMMEVYGDYSLQFDRMEDGCSVYHACGFGEGYLFFDAKCACRVTIGGQPHDIFGQKPTLLPLSGADGMFCGEIVVCSTESA